MSRVDVVTICIYICMYLMLLLLWVDRGSVGGKGVSGAVSRATLSRTVVCRIVASGVMWCKYYIGTRWGCRIVACTTLDRIMKLVLGLDTLGLWGYMTVVHLICICCVSTSLW